MLKPFVLGLLALLLPFPSPAEEPEASPAILRETILRPFDYKGGPVPVAFFDADSTLRVDRHGGYVPLKPANVILIPGTAEKLDAVSKQGFFIAIVSNQEDTTAHVGLRRVDATMAETVRQLEERGARVNYFDYSTRKAEAKPNRFMFETLERKLQEKYGPEARIDLQRSFMVGDAAYRRPGEGYPGDLMPNGEMGLDFSNFDRKFAENNGIAFHEPNKYFGWKERRLMKVNDLIEHEKKQKASLPNPECGDGFRALAPG